jgi:hypothetical protein
MVSITSPRLFARQWSVIVGTMAGMAICSASQGGITTIPGPLPEANSQVLLPSRAPAPIAQNHETRPADVLFGQDPSTDLDLLGSSVNVSNTVSLPTEPAEKSNGTDDSQNPPASAIPIPAALQSGLSGMAALALAGFLRRVRRALRS